MLNRMKHVAIWTWENAWGLYLAMYFLIPGAMFLALTLSALPSIAQVDDNLVLGTLIVAVLYGLWYMVYVLGVVKLYHRSFLGATIAFVLSAMHVYVLYWVKIVGYASDGHQPSYDDHMKVGNLLLLLFLVVPSLVAGLTKYLIQKKTR